MKSIKIIKQKIYRSVVKHGLPSNSDNEHWINGIVHNAIDAVQRWIPIEVELPPLGIEVLFKSEKWINEDYNPDGVRIGFMDDGAGYVTAYYCNYHDEYHTRNSEEDDEQFEQSKAEDQIPTHWRQIEIK